MRPIDEQTVLVTGATDGIGEEIARNLTALGATVLVHGRSEERVRAAGERIGGSWEPAVADLGSFAAVRDLAASIDSLDALVNNAGVGFGTAPSRGARTEDGHEVTWQVNVLSAFLLTVSLRETLAAGDDGARVVHMSSGVASSGGVDLSDPDDPSGVDPYRQSKVALMLLAREMGDRWRDDGIAVNAVSPGWIATKMGGSGGGDLAAGADTATWLLTDPSLDGVTGGYYADRREEPPNPQTEDAEARRRLWQICAGATGAGDR